MTDAEPALSVVVALISGKREDLRRCLEALSRQKNAPPMEILAPYDPPCKDVLALQSEFPAVHFLPLEKDTAAERAGAGREHHDSLRTLGLQRARAPFVILTEDHAHAEPGWCAGLVEALESYPQAGCIGGAVEFGGQNLLAYATYLCDFIRYANPLPESTAWYVSDSNVCYRRAALNAIADSWRSDYHETIVHAALARAGFELRLTPRVVVWQARSGLTLSAALRERFVWGRSFAGSRFLGAQTGARRRYALLAPLLPVVLTSRYFTDAWHKRHPKWRLAAALPFLYMLATAWAIGEFVGYASGRPR